MTRNCEWPVAEPLTESHVRREGPGEWRYTVSPSRAVVVLKFADPGIFQFVMLLTSIEATSSKEVSFHQVSRVIS